MYSTHCILIVFTIAGMSVCTVPVPVPATGFLLFTHSQSGTERLLPVGHHSACVVVRHNHRLCLSLGGADLREMRIWARKTGKRPIKNKNDTKETTSHEIVRKLFFLVVFRRCDRFAFVRKVCLIIYLFICPCP